MSFDHLIILTVFGWSYLQFGCSMLHGQVFDSQTYWDYKKTLCSSYLWFQQMEKSVDSCGTVSSEPWWVGQTSVSLAQKKGEECGLTKHKNGHQNETYMVAPMWELNKWNLGLFWPCSTKIEKSNQLFLTVLEFIIIIWFLKWYFLFSILFCCRWDSCFWSWTCL